MSEQQQQQRDAPNGNNNNNRTAKKPDHGENFVPGSESAPDNLAPKPLDHFKRGYRERAELRDREMGQLNSDFNSHSTSQYNRANEPSDKITHRNDRYRDNNNNHHSSARHVEVANLVDRISRPGCNLYEELDYANSTIFKTSDTSKAMTAILSTLARRKKIGVALAVWQWMDHAGIEKNVFHYNSLISVCEKMKDSNKALGLVAEMERNGVKKNEVTFSSAISACEKCGQWRKALNLLDQMKREGVGRTAIAYNAAISACEKGLVPNKALEIFDKMKKEGVTPTVITFSALISACEKGQQWKLALEVLEEMKAAGHGANVIAYSACISALSKGQQWEKALDLFRDIERSGGTPSVVTYNATMTALEKGLQWERALDLFDEMKLKRLAVTVVSYGSAIAACEKGFQWRQCLEFLDEMTEVGIRKNVIIFGAAMSCMEKCCRADIAFQLMDRMKIEGVSPNVHIYNSAISACARCNLWEKGLELFNEMERVGVVRDVVSYNAVLDAVCSQVPLARRLFKEGVERGFYARVSRLGTQWLELDLHFLSLGGGEIGLGWWFEECLVPYLVNSSKLEAVQSIDIVTGYGKTRMRGARHGDDGMRKRVRAMLSFMNIREVEQPNKGRIHVDKDALIAEVKKNNGRIIFDEEGYRRFKMEQTTANAAPDVPQKVRQKITPVADTRSRGGRDRMRNNYSNDRHRGPNHGAYDRNRDRESSYRGEPPRGGREMRPSGTAWDRPRSPPRDSGRYNPPQDTQRFKSQDNYPQRDERAYDSRRGYGEDNFSHRDGDQDYHRRPEDVPRYGVHVDRGRNEHTYQERSRHGDNRGYHRSRSPERHDPHRPHGDHLRYGGGRYEDDRADYRKRNPESARENVYNSGGYSHYQNDLQRPSDAQRRPVQDDQRPQGSHDGSQQFERKRSYDQYESAQPKRGYDLDANARRMP